MQVSPEKIRVYALAKSVLLLWVIDNIFFLSNAKPSCWLLDLLQCLQVRNIVFGSKFVHAPVVFVLQNCVPYFTLVSYFKAFSCISVQKRFSKEPEK